MVTLLTPARAAIASMVAAGQAPFDQQVGRRLQDGQPGPLTARAGRPEAGTSGVGATGIARS